ncbi:box C/D snoRNA protein 1 [Harpegnathos saltator]|uniref:Box C/D snoRNA protein 1 n=1 Tax=Harpegnathos saltator TaxID=610380 RepID=E2BTD0_HARSA|nr:box C/D snoRNA protein 1 [Harpegnathos saltator]EFN81051.1 Zinc finger HIT domain-containing protein 6 [Harpegnathos saltator]
MAASSVKLKDCEVCGATKAKYTCPKCEVRTCSLVCVNVHKRELKCDGIRDKTKFVSLKSFTDLDLLSDYRLLEEIGKTIDTCKRNPEKKYVRQGVPLPLYLHKLKAAAFSKRTILLFMPQNFSRRKANTTYLNWKTNELFWRIEWIFPQADNIKWTMKKVLDTTRISTLIDEILDPTVSLADNVDITELNVKLSKNLSDKLQFYKSAGLNNIKVLLKAEKVKNSSCRFHDLDLTLSLRENLRNKTIIEFPTLYVVIKHHSDMYEIIDTDEETSDIEYKSHTARRKNIDKSTEKEKESKPVNYFFNDFSESDDEKIDGSHENKQSNSLNIPHYEQLSKTSSSSL